MSEWISVQDRLPAEDDAGSVLAHFKHAVNNTGDHRMVVSADFVRRGSGRSAITHWCPIPKPPDPEHPMQGLREALKMNPSRQGVHVYTDPRDSDNWAANAKWHEQCRPELIEELLRDAERLDKMEALVHKEKSLCIHVHDGVEAMRRVGGVGLGLASGSMKRSLREALDKLS